MSNLDDLGIPSISEVSNDEALELLRQIRLSRRIPTKTRIVTKKAEKATVSADQAAELLKLIMGASNDH
jgi:DNA replication protein DnaC